MKKEYINPELTVIDIKLNGVLLNGSPLTAPVDPSGQTNGDALAPGSDFFDDDF